MGSCGLISALSESWPQFDEEPHNSLLCSQFTKAGFSRRGLFFEWTEFPAITLGLLSGRYPRTELGRSQSRVLWRIQVTREEGTGRHDVYVRFHQVASSPNPLSAETVSAGTLNIHLYFSSSSNTERLLNLCSHRIWQIEALNNWTGKKELGFIEYLV